MASTIEAEAQVTREIAFESLTSFRNLSSRSSRSDICCVWRQALIKILERDTCFLDESTVDGLIFPVFADSSNSTETDDFVGCYQDSKSGTECCMTSPGDSVAMLCSQVNCSRRVSHPRPLTNQPTLMALARCQRGTINMEHFERQNRDDE